MFETRSAHVPRERRMHRRTAAVYRATARFRDGTSVRCHVTSVSPMGALIEFESVLELPCEFRITIPDELFAAECELSHQNANVAGVLFTSGRLEALARFG